MNMLKSNAIHQLNELNSLLTQLNPEEYNKSLKLLQGGTIGKHVRHVLEFYQCILLHDNSIVNYDKRVRNLMLETCVVYASDKLTEIIDSIEVVKTETNLILQVEYGEDTQELTSSFNRELIYNIEHTIHHLAILRIAVHSEFQHITLSESFGYADSTIRYMKSLEV